MQTVTAIDDGGISLSSNRDFFVSRVLSLEVSHSLIKLILKAKRMKSKERTKLETTYAHAAQIFCEMLGQVCHGEFYQNTYMKYQEVIFPLLTNIDGRHLLSMRDMQRAISSTLVFQTPISGTSLSMVRNTLQVWRIKSMSCLNHPVNISCVTPPNKQLSSPSSQNCLITWSAGTAISGTYAITRGINLFRNQSASAHFKYS